MGLAALLRRPSPPERSRAARRRPRRRRARKSRGEGGASPRRRRVRTVLAAHELALGFERETRRDGRVVAVLARRNLRTGSASTDLRSRRKSVCRRRHPSPTTGDPPRPRRSYRCRGGRRSRATTARASPRLPRLELGVAVETTTCELCVAFASCVPSSVSRASRASHAASDAADAASAALACAFHPAVSTPRVCSTAAAPPLGFAALPRRSTAPRAGSAALGASGDRMSLGRGAVEKHGSSEIRTRRSAGASRRRSGRRQADGTAGSS